MKFRIGGGSVARLGHERPFDSIGTVGYMDLRIRTNTVMPLDASHA